MLAVKHVSPCYYYGMGVSGQSADEWLQFYVQVVTTHDKKRKK
jgi:hypothetical protein